jgi:hypothetical protein
MSIKKTIIPKSGLPPLSPNGEYVLRYRIISEDKNRTSHWSPIYHIDAKPFIQVDSNIEVTPAGILIVWGEQNKAPLYDIFISFKVGGSWQPYYYQGSSSTHSYSFERPVRPAAIGYEATDVKAIIQLAGIEKNINDVLKISVAAEKSTEPAISGGKA